MIDTQCCYAGHKWLGNDICAVVGASYANLQNSYVNLRGKENMVCHECNESEIPRHIWGCWHFFLIIYQTC